MIDLSELGRVGRSVVDVERVSRKECPSGSMCGWEVFDPKDLGE